MQEEREPSFEVLDLSSFYTFANGNPVPDGMSYSYITAAEHPSNVTVFNALNIDEALAKALHSFRHGQQASVWLNATPFPFENDPCSNDLREEKVTAAIKLQLGLLQGKFDAVRSRRRTFLSSEFAPHIDGRVRLDRDKVPSLASRGDRLRIIYNFDGIPTVLFGRNIAVAEDLFFNQDPISIKRLGPASICPNGSAVFIPGCDWGLGMSIIHSAPHIPYRNGAVQRDVFFADAYYPLVK
jgi:hypothetical protein